MTWKEARICAGLTLRAAAEKLDVSPQAVGQWETENGTTPSPEKIPIIAELYGITPLEVLHLEKEPERGRGSR